MGRSDGREVQMYPPIKEVRIELHWRDLGSGFKTFANVHELAQFLKDNPLLAQAVGYVSRKVDMAKPPFALPRDFLSLPRGEQVIWLDRARDFLDSFHIPVDFSGQIFTSMEMLDSYIKKLQSVR